MKKYILILCCFILICFSSCNIMSSNESLSDVKITSDDTIVSDLEGLNDTTFSFKSELYEIFLDEIVQNNPIDSAFLLEDVGSSTMEMQQHYKKYIEIWQQEMEYSSKRFKDCLNEEDRSIFDEHQLEWQRVIDNDFAFINTILLTDKYDVKMGSSFTIELATKYLKLIRERTLQIKYWQYCLESNRSDGNSTVDFQRTGVVSVS